MYGQLTVVTLPSGNKVRAKKPSLVTLIVGGVFPNDMMRHAIRLYNKDIPEQPTRVEDPEQARAALQLMDIMLPKVLIHPSIGNVTAVEEDEEGVQKGTVMLEDVPDGDKQWLFLWGQGLLPDDASKPLPGEVKTPAAAEVAPFRGESERSDAGSGSAEVQPAAVEPDRAPTGEPVSA
jgi:hypothetical protein